MLHPSYKELINTVNEKSPEGAEVIDSRYTLVIACARRARQINMLNSGSEKLVPQEPNKRNLSVAVDEFNDGLVHVLAAKEEMPVVEEVEEEVEEVISETEESVTEE